LRRVLRYPSCCRQYFSPKCRAFLKPYCVIQGL